MAMANDAIVDAVEAVEVVEYTDPWCSWAWGTEPKLRRLRWRYGDRFRWRRVMGDLVADQRVARPDFDPVVGAPRLAEYWRGVHEHTGMPWPVHLRWPPVASGVAGRAVKAAERQGDVVAGRFLRALRESCFVFSAPADSLERIGVVARWVDGLDPDELAADLETPEVEESFLADRADTRNPNEYVRTLNETHEGKGNAKPDGDGWRYVFPTLLFRGPGGEHTVPGWQPWDRYVAAMEAATPGSTADPRPDPTPAQALDEWRLVTDHELVLLCGEGAAPPSGATPYDWGKGQAWLHNDIKPLYLPS